MQPWTNFYKSKDHNRHPDMPKKPLSMYMLFYSEMREEVLKTNPKMSMPEVAKACSEKYQKLSDKKKAKFKQRCDEMRKEYEIQMEMFYQEHPEQRPVKAEKASKKAAAAAARSSLQQQQQQLVQVASAPSAIQIMPGTSATAMQHHHLQHQQPQTVMATVQTPMAAPMQLEVTMPPAPMPPPPPPPQQRQVNVKQEEHVAKTHQQYPNAPERPPKPFELYFKNAVDECVNDPNYDRQAMAERCRQEWKGMKTKKKFKWIKKGNDQFREYENRLAEFQQQHPDYIPAERKHYLTQEDQKTMDKAMGRPEKPPSSAYSLFSKEMLNHPEIKKFPSKERMAAISQRWKLISQDQKDRYQAQVNDSMSIYRQKYEAWFNELSEEDRNNETARMNTSKSKPKGVTTAGVPVVPKPATSVKHQQNTTTTQQQQQQQQQQQTQQHHHHHHHQPPVTFSMTPLLNQAPAMVVAAPKRDPEKLRQEILNREPVEPARSRKQLFINEWLQKHKKKKLADAKAVWNSFDKEEKKKWGEKLEPLRQKYIELYTVFVRRLDKEELELYTQLKEKRDEEEKRKQDESSESEVSESSESDSESGSESESD